MADFADSTAPVLDVGRLAPPVAGRLSRAEDEDAPGRAKIMLTGYPYLGKDHDEDGIGYECDSARGRPTQDLEGVG